MSTGFEIDQQDFIVEGAWHLSTSTRERYFGGYDDDDAIGREIFRGSFLMLAAGVRSRELEGPIAPFYQVLLGGLQGRFRTDYEYPESLDVDALNARCGIWAGDRQVGACLNVRYREFREEREAGFVMQPGVGLDVRVRRGLKFRVVTDLLVIANREYVVVVPRVSARVVVGFGR